MSGEILDFDKKKDAGCVAKNCHYVFKAGDSSVCTVNPPVPVPIPQVDQFTHQPIITIQPVFPPCVTDTVCGRFMPKDFILGAGQKPN